MLEQLEPEEPAKLAWLRRAASDGFKQIERGKGIAFNSSKDLDAFIDQLDCQDDQEG